jgi:hypothetical protein
VRLAIKPEPARKPERWYRPEWRDK